MEEEEEKDVFVTDLEGKPESSPHPLLLTSTPPSSQAPPSKVLKPHAHLKGRGHRKVNSRGSCYSDISSSESETDYVITRELAPRILEVSRVSSDEVPPSEVPITPKRAGRRTEAPPTSKLFRDDVEGGGVNGCRGYKEGGGGGRENGGSGLKENGAADENSVIMTTDDTCSGVKREGSGLDLSDQNGSSREEPASCNVSGVHVPSPQSLDDGRDNGGIGDIDVGDGDIGGDGDYVIANGKSGDLQDGSNQVNGAEQNSDNGDNGAVENGVNGIEKNDKNGDDGKSDSNSDNGTGTKGENGNNGSSEPAPPISKKAASFLVQFSLDIVKMPSTRIRTVSGSGGVAEKQAEPMEMETEDEPEQKMDVVTQQQEKDEGTPPPSPSITSITSNTNNDDSVCTKNEDVTSTSGAGEEVGGACSVSVTTGNVRRVSSIAEDDTTCSSFPTSRDTPRSSRDTPRSSLDTPTMDDSGDEDSCSTIVSFSTSLPLVFNSRSAPQSPKRNSLSPNEGVGGIVGGVKDDAAILGLHSKRLKLTPHPPLHHHGNRGESTTSKV